MKIENLFVTWQQRSAQSNMPISVSTTMLSQPQNVHKTHLNVVSVNIFRADTSLNPMSPYSASVVVKTGQ